MQRGSAGILTYDLPINSPMSLSDAALLEQRISDFNMAAD